jgi:hypothetical protein
VSTNIGLVPISYSSKWVRYAFVRKKYDNMIVLLQKEARHGMEQRIVIANRDGLLVQKINPLTYQ